MTLRRSLSCVLAAAVVLAAAGPAAAAKPERYRYELTEFAGSSHVMTGHEIYPCTPDTDVVAEGTLDGSFNSPLSGIENVRIGRSSARGKIVADAGLAAYQQGGIREGDAAPCGADEGAPFAVSCVRTVPTIPGVVGRFVDASKKKVEVEWTPTFDGVEARFSPDFNCIPRMGAIPIATQGNFPGGCEEHRYPRRIFTGDDAFELEIVCAVDFIPFTVPAGLGTYAATYRAQLTLAAVEDD